LKTDSEAVDLDTWHYFKALLDHLTVDGMSSEDDSTADVEGVHIPVFKVKLCTWRAPEIKTYLDIIDDAPKNPALSLSNSRSVPRLASSVEGTSMMKGLPRQMYNQAWLEGLEQERPLYVQQELRVSQETFELLTVVTGDINITI